MLLLVGFIIATLINVILSTLKSVITVKGGKVVASIVNAISYGFNTIVIKSISDVELWIAIVVTVAANLVGVYIALTIIKKFEKRKRKTSEKSCSCCDERASNGKSFLYAICI